MKKRSRIHCIHSTRFRYAKQAYNRKIRNRRRHTRSVHASINVCHPAVEFDYVVFSAPKLFEFQNDCEDRFLANPSRIILSDGASESFDSKHWAEKLVSVAMEESGLFSFETLQKARKQYFENAHFESLSWSQQIAIERGSFATILIADRKDEQLKETEVSITAIGDSEAFLVDASNGELLDLFPYKTHADFLQHPILLSTRPEHDKMLNKSTWGKIYRKKWDLKGRLLFLMTDAIADWALRSHIGKKFFWLELAKKLTDEKIKDTQFESIIQLIITERTKKQLKIDDVTIVLARLTDE